MSLNYEGFDATVEGTTISIEVFNNHPLLKLANTLPWEDMLQIILPDLKETNRLR